MTLRRRLLLLLLLATPVVWVGAMAISFYSAHHEINELFDTELVRLARQLQATLPSTNLGAPTDASSMPPPLAGKEGEAEPKDLLLAVWDSNGRLVLVDREGLLMPYLPGQKGFVELMLAERPWRAYYLPSPSGRWLVAAGQRHKERRELVLALTAGPLLPWLLTLPVLLLVMAVGLKRVLRPVAALSAELACRAADDLKPLRGTDLPADLRPLVDAMNAQFERTAGLLQRERRFTADAAHELRTPLAALQAQWDAARLSPDSTTAADTMAKLGQGLARLSRLVTQMLQLSRVEHLDSISQQVQIDWIALIGEVLSDVLTLAEHRHVELACEWPEGGAAPLPLLGAPPLLAAMLRNLLDNGLRYSPAGGHLTLRFGPDTLDILDDGPGVPAEQLPRLGDRFYRPAGQVESGSGLGLSIVRRIAELHGLTVDWGPREEAQGFRVRLRRNTPRQQALGQASAGH